MNTLRSMTATINPRWHLRSAMALTAVIAAMTVAAPARADDQSYLAALAGTNTLWMSPQDKLSMGHMICGWIRDGMNPGDIVQQIKVMDGAAIVDTARHELCPDTLH